MRLLLCMLALVLVGCAPIRAAIESPSDYAVSAPFDETWKRTVSFFATQHLPVTTLEREGGRIVARSATLTAEQVRDWIDCGSDGGTPRVEMYVSRHGLTANADFNVSIRPAGESSIVLTTVALRVSDTRPFADSKTDCKQNGGFERQMLEAIKPPPVVADPAEYRPFLDGGTASLTGQAFMKTRGGDVKLAAGNPVHLDPKTTYATEWMWRRGVDFKAFSVPDPNAVFQSARRVTTADAQGRFRFDGLAPGWYYVTTFVRWETGGLDTPTQGGILADSVKVDAGKTADIVITR